MNTPLSSDLANQLRQHLTNLRLPIALIASTDESAKSTEMMALLEQIAPMSDLIELRHDGTATRRPSFIVERRDDAVEPPVSVEFAGVPLGHEFTSLVLALLHVGGHPPKVSDDTIAQIRSLDGDYHFETFFSLSCQNCPDVVQALNTMSVLNPRIRHTAIDGGSFADEAEARGVMAVPSVYLNGELFVTGRQSLDELLAKLDTGAATRAAAAIDDKEPFEILVVGGGPAGAAASIYTARKGIRTGVVAERFGGQVNDTMAIENFISVPRTEGPKLAAALENHARAHDIDVIDGQVAVGLVPAGDGEALHTVQLASGAALQARSVIVSTGARWRHMNVPGENEYLNRGVAFCPHCDGPLFAGKPVAVIGGGNSGVEAAIDLAGIVSHVTLIEFDTQLRADDVLQQALRRLPNVDVIVNAQTTEVVGDGDRVTGLVYRERDTGDEHKVDLAGIFVQIGLVPNTDWLDGVVERSPRGEVVIDDRGATNVAGIYAAGDCTTVPYKQIVIALGAGATAALSAFDYLVRNPASS